jgi:hypothetical protein
LIDASLSQVTVISQAGARPRFVFTIDYQSAGMETTYIINRLRKATAQERALIGGLLGVISALLSAYVEAPDYLVFFHTPLPPAFWFGLVLCTSVAIWHSSAVVAVCATMLTSFIAWAAAVQAALHIHDAINSQFPPGQITFRPAMVSSEGSSAAQLLSSGFP